MNNGRHLSIVAVLIVISTVLSYTLLSAIYQLPIAASAEAGPIDQMFRAHFFMIAFLFSLIVVSMLYSVIVFRRRPGDESEGVYFHGSTALEVSWTILPLAAVLGFSIWGAQVLSEITRPKTNEMVVNVVARQWSWVFSYPEHEAVGNVDELVLPVNRTIRLEMTSPDVIHSFWVPEFRVKQDVVPGRTTTLRVTPTQVGEFRVLCAEICGFGHADMRANVRVLSERDFMNWIEERTLSLANMTPEERGETWAANYGCLACHSIDGSILIGPTWQGLLGREITFTDGTSTIADEEYIRHSILEPDDQIVVGFPAGVMPPNYGEQFAAREAEIQEREGVEIDIIEDIIAYIRTLE